MVFPQAEIEIVTDSRDTSPDEGSTSTPSAKINNPKNPDVADVLRMLSVGSMDDTQSETLPDDEEDDWGCDTNSGFDAIYESDDFDCNLNVPASSESIPIDTLTVITPSAIGVPTDLIQIQSPLSGALSAFSARSLSAPQSLSTTIINTTVATLPPPPTIDTVNTPESSSGPPAPKRPTRASNRRAKTLEQQPLAVPGTVTDSPGPSEVCLVLVIIHLDII